LIPSEAPSSPARASFESLLEVAITRAPASRANWSAKSETPPVPWIKTESPGLTPPVSTRGRRGRGPPTALDGF
jgi:hypothetical protein